MSRTSKFSLATAFICMAFASTAQAQTAGDPAMLTTLMQGMSSGTTSSADIGSEIEARIRELMTQMETAPSRDTGRAVTIEEIDRINRAAERERTELEFEKARNERSQLEITRLLALYEAVKAIEADKREESEAIQAQIAKMADEAEGQRQPDPSAAAFSADQSNLPRIDSISGVAGVFTAEAEFAETITTLRVGQRTMNGFVVEEISPFDVVLKGSSGNMFRLTPKAPAAPQPRTPMGPGNVIDLSSFPMAQF